MRKVAIGLIGEAPAATTIAGTCPPAVVMRKTTCACFIAAPIFAGIASHRRISGTKHSVSEEFHAELSAYTTLKKRSPRLLMPVSQ
jgi:hypothetical protein